MSLEKKIEDLKEVLLKMSDSVVFNIEEAINFYLGKETANEINDDLVDQYERLIEEMCINILLKERPFARDLKEVTGILKLVSDVERIGDHAEDIYDFAKRLVNCNCQKCKEIEPLTIYVIQMIKKAVKSYIDLDYNLASEVIKDDDYVDKKYLEIIESLSNEKQADKNYLQFAIYTTLVVKYLERIADHSVNIAEWVGYIISGYYKDKMIL